MWRWKPGRTTCPQNEEVQGDFNELLPILKTKGGTKNTRSWKGKDEFFLPAAWPQPRDLLQSCRGTNVYPATHRLWLQMHALQRAGYDCKCIPCNSQAVIANACPTTCRLWLQMYTLQHAGCNCKCMPYNVQAVIANACPATCRLWLGARVRHRDWQLPSLSSPSNIGAFPRGFVKSVLQVIERRINRRTQDSSSNLHIIEICKTIKPCWSPKHFYFGKIFFFFFFFLIKISRAWLGGDSTHL